MGTTTYGLPYPEQTDEVDVPTDMGELATAADARLYRALARTSTTRPTLVSGDRGFLVDESDTGNLVRWNGTTWVTIGSNTGDPEDPGDGATVGGRWTAGSTAQSIPNADDTEVAFGTAVGTPSGVTRTALGAGHRFTVASTRLWAVYATVRFATTPTAGEKAVGIWYGSPGYDDNIAHAGGTREGIPATYSLGSVLPLAAGTDIVVLAWNGTGSPKNLEPNAGAWVHLDIWAVG